MCDWRPGRRCEDGPNRDEFEDGDDGQAQFEEAQREHRELHNAARREAYTDRTPEEVEADRLRRSANRSDVRESAAKADRFTALDAEAWSSRSPSIRFDDVTEAPARQAAKAAAPVKAQPASVHTLQLVQSTFGASKAELTQVAALTDGQARRYLQARRNGLPHPRCIAKALVEPSPFGGW